MSIYGPHEFPILLDGVTTQTSPPSGTLETRGRVAQVISLVMLQLCTLFMLPVERALFMTGLVSLGDGENVVKMW